MSSIVDYDYLKNVVEYLNNNHPPSLHCIKKILSLSKNNCILREAGIKEELTQPQIKKLAAEIFRLICNAKCKGVSRDRRIPKKVPRLTVSKSVSANIGANERKSISTIIFGDGSYELFFFGPNVNSQNLLTTDIDPIINVGPDGDLI